MALNERLLKEQNVSPEQKENLIQLHKDLEEIFEKARQNKGNQEILKDIAKEVEDIEFALQRNWNFPENRNMHSWWIKIPGCTCPQMDNADYRGTDVRIYTSDCPIHGHLLQNT